MNDEGTRMTGDWSARAAIATVTALGLALSCACTTRPSGGSSAGAAGSAVRLESVEGSPIKRIILSRKAAERLGVQTGVVSEQVVVPTQLMGGIVVDPSAGGGETESDPGGRGGTGGRLWVRLALSPPEWERLAREKPARILPLQTRKDLPDNLIATPTGQPPIESVKSGMLSVFYVLPPGVPGLALGDRVRVEVQFQGDAAARKLVPYSAVYYDETGAAWVYVNTAPLTFVRQPIGVERVSGDRALLSSGPAVGTAVATVAVSLLRGAEVFGK